MKGENSDQLSRMSVYLHEALCETSKVLVKLSKKDRHEIVLHRTLQVSNIYKTVF